MRVLLFSGTTEGKELAIRLANAGVSTYVSVASEVGARSMPTDVDRLETIVGPLTYEEKLELFKDFDVIVDATHPFAKSISTHVKEAADATGKPLIRVVREPSDLTGCLVVPTLEEAIALIPDDAIVLTTTGSKQIGAYTVLPRFAERIYARVLDDAASVDACHEAGLTDDHIIAKRGPFSLEDNINDIDLFGITALVTKDSGAAGGFPEKAEACRQRNITCIAIARPDESDDGLYPDSAFDVIMGYRR
ncbi:MAG: precorrin-6A reductase [Eggerthellaceae bacterium]|nr:precorrin-6A reductase [Eggerthellaceae bacterium]